VIPEDVVPQVMVPAKLWWQSKTVWFNVLGALVGIIGVFLENYQPLGIVLPPGWAAWLAMIALVGNFLLRFQTAQPLGTTREKRVSVSDPYRR
jgi:uncharacterized membrane protein